MKILLMGEYSGVHNNLAEALRKDGHEVLLISDGDSYKAFDSDYFIKYKHLKSKIKPLHYGLTAYYILLNLSGLKGSIQIIKYIRYLRGLKDYDVVQLINPIFLSEYGSLVNYFVFKYLKKNNKKVFLCALGDDYYWNKYCIDKKFSYSMFDRLNIKTFNKYLYSLYYIYGFFNPYLNKYIVKNVNAILPGLYDYYAAYKDFSNCTEIVPIIVKEPNNIQNPIEFNYPIRIFHGWQPGKELRKGNDIFDKAIKKIVKKYKSKVQYDIVGGISYSEYVKRFEDSHIFIDQCFSQDMGVNALLGMQAGKVVFSGFEKEVKEYYDIGYDPLINAIPDESQIYNNISRVIEDPSLIKQYSVNAKKFIKQFHNAQYVLKKYYQIWQDY